MDLPTHAPPEPPRYLRWAFANVVNLGLFLGALAAAAATGNGFLALAAMGLEAVWLLIGPDAHAFRLWVDRHHREKWQAAAQNRLRAIVEALPERERVRVEELEYVRAQILKEAKQNPSFAGILLEMEFGKLDQLRDGFIVLAHACTRAEEHLAGIDVRDLDRQMQHQKRVLESVDDAQSRTIAQRNLEVLDKRQDALDDVKTFLTRARGQMSLIDNTVSLMRDRVLTMRSPQELAEPLDDLLRGMDAVRAAAQESDEMLAAVTPVQDRVEGQGARGEKAGIGTV